MSTAEERAEERAVGLGYREMPLIGAAKRCGVQWTPWMGDWFTSWSPRNSNSNAEGTWEHWVALSIAVLRHEFTAAVAPDVHAVAVAALQPMDRDSETHRYLTYAELVGSVLGEEASPS